jgi:GWxTD domain-containing protein
MRHNLLISVVSILAVISGCRPAGSLAIRNFAAQYAEIPKTPFLQAVPFSQDEHITHIFARWRYSDLVYHRNDNDQARLPQASFRLHFEVFPNYQATAMMDSGTFLMSDSLHAGSNELGAFEFDVKAPAGQNYLLNLSLIDRNSKASYTATFNILKRGQGSSSFFKASQQAAGMLYSQVLYDRQPVIISCTDTTVRSLHVSYFREHFPLPAPPFVTDERPRLHEDPDSNFLLPLEHGTSAAMDLNEQGFYFFSTDSSFREGFTLFRYSPGFPELVNARQLLIPLRYITSAKEFEKLALNSNTRSAVDSFWIATAGNTNRALTLIHDYYSRVRRANELFSSHSEGWQTDRGLIYIIYGTPTVVYRRNFQEEWVYGEVRNLRSLHFYFLKVENPFSTSDFVLSRDPNLKQTWYMAVERWRR